MTDSVQLSEKIAYVRVTWQQVWYDGHRVKARIPNGADLIVSANPNYPFERSHHLSEPKAWEAAYEATVELIQKIKLADRALMCLEKISDTTTDQEDLRAVNWMRACILEERMKMKIGLR